MIELKYIINPLMGTVIGFGTNYIAVKMLFRPYKTIKIGKITLPFTPGVIPKRREDIAKALGDTISKELFTSNDIKDVFLSQEIRDKVSNSFIEELKKDNLTIKEIILKNIDENKYINFKVNVEKIIIDKIYNGFLEINIADILVAEGSKAIKEQLNNSFLGSFVSEDKIKSMAGPIGRKIEIYLRDNIKEIVLPYIDKEFNVLENQTIEEFMEKTDISDDKLKYIVESIYVKIINDKMQAIFDSFNISEVIQNKIRNMDVKEIEKLFMVVMKKELNAIVNLGAVLGLILGLINAFLL